MGAVRAVRRDVVFGGVAPCRETLYRWLHGGYMEPKNNKAQPGRMG
jgi:hypothetical protein